MYSLEHKTRNTIYNIWDTAFGVKSYPSVSAGDAGKRKRAYTCAVWMHVYVLCEIASRVDSKRQKHSDALLLTTPMTTTPSTESSTLDSCLLSC